MPIILQISIWYLIVIGSVACPAASLISTSFAGNAQYLKLSSDYQSLFVTYKLENIYDRKTCSFHNHNVFELVEDRNTLELVMVP